MIELWSSRWDARRNWIRSKKKVSFKEIKFYYVHNLCRVCIRQYLLKTIKHKLQLFKVFFREMKTFSLYFLFFYFLIIFAHFERIWNFFLRVFFLSACTDTASGKNKYEYIKNKSKSFLKGHEIWFLVPHFLFICINIEMEGEVFRTIMARNDNCFTIQFEAREDEEEMTTKYFKSEGIFFVNQICDK